MTPRTFGITNLNGGWEAGELLDGTWWAYHHEGRHNTKTGARAALRRVLGRTGHPAPHPIPIIDIDPRTLRVRE